MGMGHIIDLVSANANDGGALGGGQSLLVTMGGLSAIFALGAAANMGRTCNFISTKVLKTSSNPRVILHGYFACAYFEIEQVSVLFMANVCDVCKRKFGTRCVRVHRDYDTFLIIKFVMSLDCTTEATFG